METLYLIRIFSTIIIKFENSSYYRHSNSKTHKTFLEKKAISERIITRQKAATYALKTYFNLCDHLRIFRNNISK